MCVCVGGGGGGGRDNLFLTEFPTGNIMFSPMSGGRISLSVSLQRSVLLSLVMCLTSDERY